MIASVEAELLPEPLLVKSLNTLSFTNSSATRSCILGFSNKGIRIVSDYLGTEQIQIYFPSASLSNYSLKSDEDVSIQTACHVASLIEAIRLCMTSRQKLPSIVQIKYSANQDAISLSSASSQTEVSCRIPTLCLPFPSVKTISSTNLIFQLFAKGRFITNLFLDFIRNQAFTSICLESDPDCGLLLISGTHSVGSSKMQFSLNEPSSIDQFNCSRPFQLTYNITIFKAALCILEFAKSSSLKICSDGILTIQAMVELSNGISYSEFMCSPLELVWFLMSNSPAEFLKTVIGKQVQVRLHSDLEYRGVLVCLDGYMNIALENAQEWSQGIPQQSFSDIFIRGNNVLFIRASS